MANGKETTGRIKAEHGRDHHQGFNDAMEKALSQLSEHVGTGTYPVEVHFHAEVEVSNPGNVGFYSVTLKQTG